MRLLSLQRGRLRLTEYTTRDCPPYAVISHRWLEDAEEVTFREMTEGSGESKAGYRKIEFCKERAAYDGIEHFWIDTCCIDKTNNTELSEAINSMFRWYRRSQRCYVYMADVSIEGYVPNKTYPQSAWEPAFRKSNWFTRGWTLQELIAPPTVQFFTAEGYLLGDKASLENLIHEISGIAISALRGDPLSDFSVNERMSWAAKRQTKREEDMAYSLFGIFDIYLPPIYGEGQERALTRVRREISDVERQKARTALNGKFLLQKAAKDGDVRLMKELLRPGSGVDVNGVDDHYRTALHYARNARIVELLVDARALANQEDINGQSPLHRAVEERRLEVVKELLSRDARTTRSDNSGKTPIDYAEDCPAATWMLQHGYRADGLFHMSWLGDVEGVTFFISQKSEVNKRDVHGETALTHASRNGDAAVAKLLLDAGADIEVKTREGNWSPLLLAVSNNRKDVVEMLIQAGARLHSTDNRNHDALAEAVYKGHWGIAKLLIEHGARIDTADHRGNTPLHCSGHRAAPDFTKFLIDNGAQVNAQNIFGGTPLLECISHNPTKAKGHIQFLLNNGANPTIANYAGYSPLSEAARVGHEEVMKVLLKVVSHPALAVNPSLSGSSSWTPLAEACYNVRPGCVRLLLDAGVNVELRNDEWYTSLHQAVRRKESSAEIVRMLVKHGASLEAKDKNDLTPLALAAKFSNGAVVQALLDAGANPDTRSYAGNPRENGYSPLLLAVDAQNEEAIRVLVNAGVELNVQTADRKYTALIMMAKMKIWHLVSVLVDGGANVNLFDAEKTTPLMEAASAGELETVRKLIKAGADRRLRDTLGRTAWVWAKHKGHGADFELLKPSGPES